MNQLENILFDQLRKYKRTSYLNFYDKEGSHYSIREDYNSTNDSYTYKLQIDGVDEGNKKIEDLVQMLDDMVEGGLL